MFTCYVTKARSFASILLIVGNRLFTHSACPIGSMGGNVNAMLEFYIF